MRLFALIAAALLAVSPAAAQRSIDFAAQAGESGAIIAALSDPAELDGLIALVGEDVGADLERAVAASGFTGKVGETARLLLGDDRFGEIHLVGIADGALRPRDWEDFGGRVGALAKRSTAERISVLAPGAGVAAMVQAAGGAVLGAYSFDKYKSEPATAADGELIFVLSQPGAARTQFNAQRRHLVEAVNWVRDMQSEPGNVLYPEEFVRRARAAFQGVGRVSISVLTERDMSRLGMGAILGVGQGSVRPPRILIVEYNGGARGDAPMVFAGKGITFDTGGISLKPNPGMWLMKSDMTGAAAVTGAVMSLAKSRAPVNVIAVAALAENMPDGGALRPGDVLKTMSGITVEIMSTDAEGRLVLSDAIWYAQQEFEPALLVDIATLTGSVGRALGDEYAGLFARDDAIADRMIAVGEASNQDLWRLPLHPNHDIQIESVIGDIKNADTGAPGASTAAAFLGSFVKPETPWAHLDIAGVDWLDPSQATPTTPSGASGFGVRLLDALARENAE